MDEGAWHSGHIYEAWTQINRAVLEVMKRLPRQTLAFMAHRASDAIIRDGARHILDWRENRHVLPDWGWSVGEDKERPRSSMGRMFAVSRA
jgi:hypothetical protein